MLIEVVIVIYVIVNKYLKVCTDFCAKLTENPFYRLLFLDKDENVLKNIIFKIPIELKLNTIPVT